MPSRKKTEVSRKAPPAVLEQVLAYVGREPPTGPGARFSGTKVMHLDALASLPAGKVYVLVVDRDMAVARTVDVTNLETDRTAERVRRDVATLRLAEMQLVERDVLSPPLPAADASSLTAGDEETLRRGGFDTAARPDAEADPAAQARAEYAHILSDAMTVGEAARLLGVNESRVRQRLGERTILGVKDGRSWRIPGFQFRGKRLVPSLDAVLPRIPRELHPVAVRRWLTTANPDLTPGSEDAPVSPLEWLASGGDPAPVVELARSL